VRSCPASPRILLLGMDSGHPWGLSFLQRPSLPCAAQLLVPTAMPKLCTISRGHFSPAWRRSRSRDDNPPKQCWGRAAGRRCGNREEPGTAEILPGSESSFPHLLGLHKICGKFYTRRCGEDKHQSKMLGLEVPNAWSKPRLSLRAFPAMSARCGQDQSDALSRALLSSAGRGWGAPGKSTMRRVDPGTERCGRRWERGPSGARSSGEWHWDACSRTVT